ncbi:lipase domain-containing protein [Phthorimaea operculella]|nr:lipase domain-containing protein [Phthorimaea operculella]
MVVIRSITLAFLAAVITATPQNVDVPEPVILPKFDGIYQDEGQSNIMDQWQRASEQQGPESRFNPDTANVLHLFTRANPSVSQPMLLNGNAQLINSYYQSSRRTVIIVHGFTQSATSDVNTVLVPAFLQGEDLNVFVYDWSRGASVINLNAPENAVASGFSLARAIDWICQMTGASPNRFHLVGFSLGAHLVGVAGRNVQTGRIAYITALDPGANMEDSGHLFGPDAATYTEAIHTNALIMGHGQPVAHADFFPNGGDLQPGCGVNFLCNHSRSFYFFAETLVSNANWRAVRCGSLTQARLGLCVSIFGLRMGGLNPKNGQSGLYHVRTNAEPPFQPLRDAE